MVTPLTSLIDRFRPLLWNGLFIVYLWQFHPLLMQRLQDSSHSAQPDLTLGLFLLAMPLFELSGFFFKRPFQNALAAQYPNEKAGTAGVIVYLFGAIFHLGAAAMLVLVALQIMGIGFTETTPPGWQIFGFLLFFITLGKEAFFVVMVFPGRPVAQSAPTPGNRAENWLNRLVLRTLPARVGLKEWLLDALGDLCLLVFSAVVYTALWDFVTAGSPVTGRGSDWFLAYLGVSIYFWMVYVATRLVSFLQEISLNLSPLQRRLSIASSLLAWLAALLALPVR